ncbi:GNAT family N-acetyltransferase [bacterium]|nr:GNAT family N-acetyltransferase [bacterium]
MHAANYQIRKAKHGDEQAIHDVHMYSIMNVCIHAHGKEEVAGWGQRPFDYKKWSNAIDKHWVWVVEDQITRDIKGIGCLILNKKEKCADLAALYFHPDIIGMGFGKKMIAAMLQISKENRINAIKLDSSLTALGFYKKMGFEQTGPRVKEEIGGSMVSGIPMQLKIQT